MNTPRAARIAISGSYGGMNLGDEAILGSILKQLRLGIPAEITVLSRNVEDTLRRHPVDHVFPLRGLSRREAQDVVRGLDLFILGGGGILYDRDAELYLREVFLAHEAGIPVMVLAVSAGPLKDTNVRARVREALQAAALITVRDRQSVQLLEEIGLDREIELTADPALLTDAEPVTIEELLRNEAIDPAKRLIGLSVREPGPAAPGLEVEHYHQLVADAADYMADRYEAEIVFFPFERRMFDVQHSHGVVARMRHALHATVLKREYTPGQIVSLLMHFEFAVGMRLHFLIFSALAEVPFMALPYASKISGFLDELRINAPDLKQVSAGQLIANIDRTWSERDSIRRRIRGGLHGLKARARRNNELAIRLAQRLAEAGTEA